MKTFEVRSLRARTYVANWGSRVNSRILPLSLQSERLCVGMKDAPPFHECLALVLRVYAAKILGIYSQHLEECMNGFALNTFSSADVCWHILSGILHVSYNGSARTVGVSRTTVLKWVRAADVESVGSRTRPRRTR